MADGPGALTLRWTERMSAMQRKKVTPPTGLGADGPLIALCEGHRCDALHRLADGQKGADRLRPAIATSQGAVLVSTQCLGACASGAVAAVARRNGATGMTGQSVWLGGVDHPAVLGVLLGWIESGGSAGISGSGDPLPLALQNAVFGVGTPIRDHRPSADRYRAR